MSSTLGKGSRPSSQPLWSVTKNGDEQFDAKSGEGLLSPLDHYILGDLCYDRGMGEDLEPVEYEEACRLIEEWWGPEARKHYEEGQKVVLRVKHEES